MMKKKNAIKHFSTKSTYFLIARNLDGVLVDFIGPILEEEIQDSREEYNNEEDEDLTLEILDELYFKTVFRNEYLDDLHENWPTYLNYFLTIAGWGVEGRDPIFPDPDGEEFTLYIRDVGIIYRYSDALNISFFVSCSPQRSAELYRDVSAYVGEVYEVMIQPSVYESQAGETLFGIKAHVANERESLLKFCSN